MTRPLPCDSGRSVFVSKSLATLGALALQAADIALVLFIRIDRALFVAFSRTVVGAQIFLGLGGFLDRFFAPFTLSTFLGVREMLRLDPGALSGGFGFDPGLLGGSFSLLAGPLFGDFLFLALKANRLQFPQPLRLMINRRVGLDHGFGLEFGKKGLLGGGRCGLPIIKRRILGLH